MTTEELKEKYCHCTAAEFIDIVKGEKAAGGRTVFQIAVSLGLIAEGEVEEIRAIGEKRGGMNEDERARLGKAVRLVAICLLLLCETRSKTEARNKALILLEYLSYGTTGKDYLPLAVNCCSYAMRSPGFTISFLEGQASIDVLAYSMITKAKFDKKDKLEPLRLKGAGSIVLEEGKLSISSAPVWEASVCSFSGHGEMMQVCTRNERDERLKASEVDSILAVESFSRTFLMSQAGAMRMKPRTEAGKLKSGNCYTVYGVKETRDGLACIPMLGGEEEQSSLFIEELVTGFYTDDLMPYIYENDYIGRACYREDAYSSGFSIKDAYIDYAMRKAEEDRRNRSVFNAKVIGYYQGANEDKDRYILISDKGYGGLMRVNAEYDTGDIVTVYVVSAFDNGNAFFINFDEPEFEYEGSPRPFVEENVLGEFVLDEDGAEADVARSLMEKKDETGNDIARSIGIILSASAENKAMARYRDMISAAFVFNVIGDGERRDRALAEAEYLEQCLRFAEKVEVKMPADTGIFSEQECRIVRLLDSMASSQDACDVAGLIYSGAGYREKEIGRLALAYVLSLSNPDEVRASADEIRRKICGLLGVADHFKGRIDKGGGKYGKGELSNVEFKSSYVFHNSTGRPDLVKQGRGQVLEAVCGFLNKDGGTVFVGVNDSGEPYVGEGYGLNADLAWFRANYASVYAVRIRQLGHEVPKPENLDSYCRFLNYEVELYFKESVRRYITISPTPDMDAIRIDVKPSRFEIAKLYTDNTWGSGVAYIRDGEETLPMRRVDQERRLMELRSVGKVEQFILTLNEAIDEKRKVILKDYASSSSNSVQDRHVVPINLVCNDENLWAYDLDVKDCREFRLCRIGSIDTDIEDARYDHSFEKGKADVFRWVNPSEDYHIRLKMSLFALNVLKDDYLEAGNLGEDELYQDGNDKWILDTHVHGLEPARRFCIGLAKQIEILDSEDAEKLRAEIRRYILDDLSLYLQKH